MTDATAAAPASKRRPSPLGYAWRILLVVIIFLQFYPFIFMVMTSFKSTHQFYHTFWAPSWPPHIQNYLFAIGDMQRYIFNSLFVTAVSLAGILTSASVTGFIFARYRFPGREPMFYGIIAMMMVPPVLMLIPSHQWVKTLGLIDTYGVLILPYIAGLQVMGIYLMRSFFSQIDNALFEAVRVDGGGMFSELWHVALPLAKPVMGVVAIVSALGVWNNFLWPYVTTSSEEVLVLTVGMLRYNSKIGGAYGRMFAGYTISAIPLGILFATSTRVFMKGITSGALKA